MKNDKFIMTQGGAKIKAAFREFPKNSPDPLAYELLKNHGSHDENPQTGLNLL